MDSDGCVAAVDEFCRRIESLQNDVDDVLDIYRRAFVALHPFTSIDPQACKRLRQSLESHQPQCRVLEDRIFKSLSKEGKRLIKHVCAIPGIEKCTGKIPLLEFYGYFGSDGLSPTFLSALRNLLSLGLGWSDTFQYLHRAQQQRKDPEAAQPGVNKAKEWMPRDALTVITPLYEKLLAQKKKVGKFERADSVKSDAAHDVETDLLSAPRLSVSLANNEVESVPRSADAWSDGDDDRYSCIKYERREQQRKEMRPKNRYMKHKEGASKADGVESEAAHSEADFVSAPTSPTSPASDESEPLPEPADAWNDDDDDGDKLSEVKYESREDLVENNARLSLDDGTHSSGSARLPVPLSSVTLSPPRTKRRADKERGELNAPKKRRLSAQPSCGEAIVVDDGRDDSAKDNIDELVLNEALASLQPNKLVNSTAIALCLEIMNPDPSANGIYESGYLSVVDPAPGNMRRFEKYRWRRCFFLLNHPSLGPGVDHWTLAIVDTQTFSYLVYDPMPDQSYRDSSVNAVYSVLPAIDKVLGVRPSWTLQPVDCRLPHCPNSVDCGVFVAMVALRVMYDDDPPEFDQIQPLIWRRFFTSLLSSVPAPGAFYEILDVLREDEIRKSADEDQLALQMIRPFTIARALNRRVREGVLQHISCMLRSMHGHVAAVQRKQQEIVDPATEVDELQNQLGFLRDIEKQHGVSATRLASIVETKLQESKMRREHDLKMIKHLPALQRAWQYMKRLEGFFEIELPVLQDAEREKRMSLSSAMSKGLQLIDAACLP